MLSESSIAFLKRLLDTPAPSGFEGPAAKVWRDEASKFAKNVTTDVAGNSMAEINPGGSPTIMLDGHIDEIGLIVQYVDDDGYVYPSPIGGWDPQVLVGQRIRFLGRGDDVVGVVGKKPIHLMKTADRDQASKMTDLWVDIGATNKAEAEERIAVGDPGVIDSKTIDFPNGRIVSRSIDDRIGAQYEQRRRARRHPLLHAVDKGVRDTDVGHRASEGADSGTDRGTEQRYEEDQSEEHAPERAAQCPGCCHVAQLTRLGLLLPCLPGDDGGVLDLDQLLSLQ